MPQRVDVSIVIPTRDRWPFLRLALASALGQEEVTVEAIVVDDASSDDTSEHLSALLDERVHVLRQERQRGPAHARNVGITEAQGEWIAFLDDDDLWSPHKLARQLQAVRATGADYVYGRAVVINEDRRSVELDVEPPVPDALPQSLIERNAMPAGSSNVLARADLLDRTGCFDERLRQLADWDMWLRMADTGRAAVCPDIVVACRRHASNMLLTDLQDVRHEFAYLADKHRSLSREHGAAFDAVAFSHWVAAGQRRAGRRRAAMLTHLQAALAYRDPGHLGCAVRVPLGEWAMGLRQPTPPQVAPPDWLRRHLSW